VKVGTRKVYHDYHIYVDYNYYSVPFSDREDGKWINHLPSSRTTVHTVRYTAVR